MQEKEKNIAKALLPPPEYEGGKKLFFLFLLIALLFHLLLFLLFKPLPQTIPEEKSTFQTHTFLLLEDAPDYGKKLREYKLEYALAYLEPQTAILPDLQSGFSTVLLEKSSRTLLPELVTASSGKKENPFQTPFSLPERPLGDLSRSLSGKYERESAGKKEIASNKEILLPLWNLGKGGIIRSWLVPDHGAEELFHQLSSQVEGPTILSVTGNGEGLPPEIRVRTSCKIPSLDQLAVRQLALYLGRNPGFFKKQAPFFASILWRLPALKEPIEVKK